MKRPRFRRFDRSSSVTVGRCGQGQFYVNVNAVLQLVMRVYHSFLTDGVHMWMYLNTGVIGVAPITQLRSCVIKIVTFKGGHPMWYK